ncbi:MAG TPA: MFS transporter [Jiangellaceae bacterium]
MHRPADDSATADPPAVGATERPGTADVADAATDVSTRRGAGTEPASTPPQDHRLAIRSGLTALILGAIGVLLAAADTYVIVLALPDMMAGVGLDVDQLQRAAPLVSMFLLGYVVVLPLAGRVSDLVGRLPVLIASLAIFAAGSMITAVATGLLDAVTGRFLQGLGGGALVPVTLALVADLWPPERRGLPLGIVGAIQELGAVLGPLYGAAVLAFADWRAIFWINLALGAALAAGIVVARVVRSRSAGPTYLPQARSPREDTAVLPNVIERMDWVGALLALGAIVAGSVAIIGPDALANSVQWGGLLVPWIDPVAITSPLALAAFAFAAGFVVRELTAARPLLDLRRAPDIVRATDLPGAALLGVALGAIVLTFAVAEPEVEVINPAGPWLLALAAAAFAAFAWRQRRATRPLIPSGALAARPAWGALVVSLFVGAALVAVLVDVPIFARTVISGSDQLDAALVLVRFLAALPVGALLGGVLIRRLAPALIAAAGMALATAGVAVMATWDTTALDGLADDVVLVAAGFGFGLAVAPINAALLAATAKHTHGVASALIVTARMVGMLAGLSGLTAIGLRRFYSFRATIDSPAVLCPETPTNCPPYNDAVREALVAQLQATFAGAAVCAAIAAVAAAVLLRPARSRA